MKWVEVLNRAVSWCDLDVAQAQASGIDGLPAADHARVVAAAGLLRRLFASAHLQQPIAPEDHGSMLQWLTSVTPMVGSGTTNSPRPIDLGGVRRQNPLPEPFESELTGALLQFLATASEPGLFEAVQRCQGIRRVAASQLLPRQLDLLFADRADLRSVMAPTVGSTPSVSQCDNLIFSQRGRRFCSKACSNANFAARKAARDPQYFAQKQERYRSRQRQVEVPETSDGEGAFVYMD